MPLTGAVYNSYNKYLSPIVWEQALDCRIELLWKTWAEWLQTFLGQSWENRLYFFFSLFVLNRYCWLFLKAVYVPVLCSRNLKLAIFQIYFTHVYFNLCIFICLLTVLPPSWLSVVEKLNNLENLSVIVMRTLHLQSKSEYTRISKNLNRQ